MSKRIFLLFLVLSILILCLYPFDQRGFKVLVKTSEGSSIPLYKQYRALVIGVSDYLYWPRLPNAVKDAQEVASALRELGFSTKVLENPASEEIKRALNKLVSQESNADDGVLIYFAGHGDTVRLADGTDLGYIVPKDCPLRSKDLNDFLANAISMDNIQTYSLLLKAKHLLAVFDSCFSGSIFALSRETPADITHKTAQPVRQYITAGGTDESVPDKSIFKDCFLEGIRGEADANRDGDITGSELGIYLESKVVNYTRSAQHPQYGKIRNLKLDKGDFVFVLGKAKPVETKVQIPPKPAGTAILGKGTLELRLPEDTRVYLDEKYIDANIIKLPIGYYTLKINMPNVWGEPTITEQIFIYSNKTKTIKYEVGELLIACYPFAKIFLDGKFFKETEAGRIKKILKGNHEIKIEKAGYPSFEKSIYINGNIINRIAIKYNHSLNKWEIEY